MQFKVIKDTTNRISAPVSYTAYALQAIMRDILNQPDLRLNFSERPLPFGFKLQTYVNAG